MQIEQLQKAIYKLERLSLQAAKEERSLIKYNFKKNIDEQILRYLPILYKYLEVFLLNETSCIKESGCYDDLKKIIGEINRTVIFNERFERADLKIEKNADWAILHPNCISYERWNKLSYMICSSLGIKFTIEKKMCDITYKLSKDIITCNTFAAISLYNKACELGYKVQKDNKKCETEFKYLITKYPNCNLNLKLYKELKKCNMTYDVIETIVCKDGNKLNVVDNQILLGEVNLNKDLTVQNIISPEQCTTTLCKTKGTHKLSDREFMELLAKDYNLDQDNKETLLKTLI